MPARDPYKEKCGFINGKELMGFYNMGQTSVLLFIAAIIALAGCLAWKVAEDELQVSLSLSLSLKGYLSLYRWHLFSCGVVH